jgi:penicillin amidase
MKRMHGDLDSHQAHKFMEVLRPVLPATVNGRRFAAWDGRYGVDSVEAAWFEEIYRLLRREVFGKELFGTEVWDFLDTQTGLTSTYHGIFDRALLGGSVRWFPNEGRGRVLGRIAAQVLSGRPARWGERTQVVMKNIIWGDKLPSWIGTDVGPVELPGCRATIPQAGLFRNGGQDTAFAASYRLVTDLGENSILTNLAGGPSGSRFSPWYTSDIERWERIEYKRLDAQAPPERSFQGLRSYVEAIPSVVAVLLGVLPTSANS